MNISNQWSIDSMKIKINVKDLELLNLKISDDYYKLKPTSESYLNLATGENKIDYHDNQNKHQFHHIQSNDETINLRSWITIQSNNIATKQRETYLVILLSSKSLKQHYFKGINDETVKIAYDFLISQTWLETKPTFKQFLNFNILDIDYKFDQPSTNERTDKIITYLNEHKRITNKQITKSYQTKDNLGYQVNTRSTGTYHHPFIKFYQKNIDFERDDHKPFIEKHLSNYNSKEILRTEISIKTKKDFQKLSLNYGRKNIKSFTIKNALQITKLKHQDSHVLSNYLNKKLHSYFNFKNQSPKMEKSKNMQLLDYVIPELTVEQQLNIIKTIEDNHSEQKKRNYLKRKFRSLIDALPITEQIIEDNLQFTFQFLGHGQTFDQYKKMVKTF